MPSNSLLSAAVALPLPPPAQFVNEGKGTWNHYAGLTGALPDAFGSLTALHTVAFVGNSLAGHVPPTLVVLAAAGRLYDGGLLLNGSGLCEGPAQAAALMPVGMPTDGPLPACASPPPGAPGPAPAPPAPPLPPSGAPPVNVLALSYTGFDIVFVAGQSNACVQAADPRPPHAALLSDTRAPPRAASATRTRRTRSTRCTTAPPGCRSTT